MRLVRTSPLDDGNFSVEEFYDDAIPTYAILSHTWGEEEVTLQDIQNGEAQGKKGYQKIRGCCAYASANGFSYVWIDTCCIDKTSSAELSEAINSMYRWYEDAYICYAYLADISVDRRHDMGASRWFTRGWTLQELIAPFRLLFLDTDWQELGTKTEMAETLFQWTGISIGVLKGIIDPETITVAQRMSWASKRRTSRIEDQAYCLMGLFGVNMPLIYGEGQKSFIRLQEEILANSDDLSIFIWKSDDQSHRGLLATSPKAFEESADIIRGSNPAIASKTPLMISSKGIHLEAPFVAVGHAGLGLAILDYATSSNPHRMMGIFVRDVFFTYEYFERVWCDRFEPVNPEFFRLAQYPFTSMCVRRTKLLSPQKSTRRWSKSTAQRDKDLEAASPDNCRMFDCEIAEFDKKKTRLYKRGRSADVFPNHMFLAAKMGAMSLIKSILSLHAHGPEPVDYDGRTPLSYATERGHTDIAWLLLMFPGVDINSQDRLGRSPLSYAAELGHDEMVWFFLARGDIRTDLRQSGGQTPLSNAARKGHHLIVDMLLVRTQAFENSYDDDGRSPLSYASEHGHERIARSLLAKSTAGIDKRDRHNMTPLCWATKGGHGAVIRLLLEEGASLETGYSLTRGTRDSKYAPRCHPTPMWLATMGDDGDSIRILLQYGAETRLRDTDSRIPFVWAVEHGKYRAAQALFEFDPDFVLLWRNAVDYEKVFMWAVKEGDYNFARLLFSFGRLDMANLRDEDGNTPLHLAVMGDHGVAAQFVIANGAKRGSTNRWGQTPLDCAQGHSMNMLLVSEYQADQSSDCLSRDQGDSGATAVDMGEESPDTTDFDQAILDTYHIV